MLYHLPSQWHEVELDLKKWCHQWSKDGRFWTLDEVKRSCVQESAVFLERRGCILLLKIVEDWELLFIWVDPVERRKGVGEQMLSELVQLSPGKRIFLEVSAINSAARDLYLKMGFKIVRERPNYYKDGSDALVMETRVP